jgi:hypothetical protein
MARGSIVWRCNECGTSTTRCKHRGGRYAVIYPVQRWDVAQGKIVKGQKWENAPLNENGASTRDLAEKLLAERLKSTHEGSYRELQNITFADFADKWLTEYVLGAVKRTTYQAYECHVRVHFKPAFGALALRAIREDTIQGYIPRSWRVGQSPSPSRITSSF